MLRMLRVWPAALASATAVAVTTLPASAAVVDPGPIGPNQSFVGLVNDHAGDATIQMGCFGPITPGETGHPLAGQTVKVLPVTGPTVGLPGFTGSAGTSVVVLFGGSPSLSTPVVLTTYAVTAAIPTTLTLPCGGTGRVEFRPSPTSSTARSSFVSVTFASQP